MNTQRSQQVSKRFEDRQPAAARKVFRYSHVVSGSPEDVFPLLCPVREADWLPGWDADLIYSESGAAEDGCVFETGPEQGTGAGLWTFTHYESPRRVAMIRFSPPVLVRIDIRLEDVGEGRTRVHWEYTLTGLAAEGNRKIQELVGSMEGRMKKTNIALDHYLRSGDLIPA